MNSRAEIVAARHERNEINKQLECARRAVERLEAKYREASRKLEQLNRAEMEKSIESLQASR